MSKAVYDMAKKYYPEKECNRIGTIRYKEDDSREISRTGIEYHQITIYIFGHSRGNPS